jgi:hypothetical protein
MANWVGYSEIPVRVDKSLAARIFRSSGVAWKTAEIRREVEWALDFITMYSGANLPHMYYAGTSADCGGTLDPGGPNACRIPNTINITYGYNDPSAGACTGTTTPPALGMVIAINDDWEWNTATFGGNTLLGVLAHELLHNLGFSHPAEHCGDYCAPGEGPCSALDTGSGNVSNAQHLYVSDILGLRAVYGQWQRSIDDHHEDMNDQGGSWYDWAVPLPQHLPLFEASSAPSVDDMLVAGRHPTTLSPVFYHWDWPSLVWSPIVPSFPGNTHVGRVGAGWDHDHGWGIVGFQTGESATTVRKTLNRMVITNPTTYGSWPLPSTTRRPGVSATYQAYGGLSVFATRSDSGQIVLHWVDGGAYSGEQPLFDAATGNPIFAYDTPSVACGDEPGFYYDCILVWAADDPLHTFRWMHFGLDPGGPIPLAVDVIRASTIVLNSAPQVTFRGPDPGPAAWIVAFTPEIAGQHYVYTMHKDIHWNASGWSLVVGHGPYARRVSAALGSANHDGELLVTD